MSDRGTHLQSEHVVAQIALERQKVTVRDIIPSGVMNAYLSVSDDFAIGISQRLAAELSAYVLAERLVTDWPKATHREPVTWWQHWKHDAGQSRVGAWWLTTVSGEWCSRRWPTRYREHVLEVRYNRLATYPEATIAHPPLGRPVIVEYLDSQRKYTRDPK